jgi:two-component system copper resistance phosphate regulon response regulator CusR
MRILIIEDDRSTALALKEQLREFYVVQVCYNGKDGLQQATDNEYDLITLDLQLPDIDGLDLCKRLRFKGITTPILMLTGQDSISIKVQGLECGADDYLTKPFSFEELLARVRVLLRRNSDKVSSDIISLSNLTIDLRSKTVKRDNKLIPLRRKEFYLLEYLMRNVGRVITRDMILNHVWSSMDEPSTNTIDVHIKYLRDHIDKPFTKKLIKTVHGLGYKIEA